MVTAAPPAPTEVIPPTASLRQVAIVRAATAAIAAAAIAAAVALGSDTDDGERAAGRFAAPQTLQSDEPVVRKGAAGAPIR